MEFWTLWCEYPVMVCSQHRSLTAAKRAALKCEKDGGAPHTIIKVETVQSWRPRTAHYRWAEAKRKAGIE